MNFEDKSIAIHNRCVLYSCARLCDEDKSRRTHDAAQGQVRNSEGRDCGVSPIRGDIFVHGSCVTCMDLHEMSWRVNASDVRQSQQALIALVLHVLIKASSRLYCANDSINRRNTTK